MRFSTIDDLKLLGSDIAKNQREGLNKTQHATTDLLKNIPFRTCDGYKNKRLIISVTILCSLSEYIIIQINCSLS